MLVLTRRTSESVVIEVDGIVVASVSVSSITGAGVRLGFLAHRGGVRFSRDEHTPVPLNDDGMAVTTIDGVLYIVVDILFRMLRVRELAAAMGFPPDYIWPRSSREAVRLIGNAVAVPQAEALIRAVLPRWQPRERGRAVA